MPMGDTMKTEPITLDSLLADGFTRRRAKEYLDILSWEESSGLFDSAYLAWAHKNGFCAESACAYGLTEDNLGDYLSDYDYWRLWPLNSWQRIWINDKLTLNALLGGSDLAGYLPVYFYYSRPEGGLLPLSGSGYAPGVEGLLACLRREGSFACKPCNGSTSAGFHHLEFRDGAFRVDGEEVTSDGIKEFVGSHPNYVFTEFIRPEASLAAINPLIHTLRALVINPTGTQPTPTIAYLRFGMEDGSRGTGANYVAPTNADICSYNVEINLKSGHYGNGRLVYANRVEDAPRHPTSGALVEGVIPQWEAVLEMMRRLSLKVSACEYLGFDACVTDKGPKIMEINSHTGVKYLQLFHPIWKDETLAPYYREKLAAINALDETGRTLRNGIVR